MGGGGGNYSRQAPLSQRVSYLAIIFPSLTVELMEEGKMNKRICHMQGSMSGLHANKACKGRGQTSDPAMTPDGLPWPPGDFM